MHALLSLLLNSIAGQLRHHSAARAACPLLQSQRPCPSPISPTPLPQGPLQLPRRLPRMTHMLLLEGRALPAGTPLAGAVRAWRICKSSCRVSCWRETRSRWAMCHSNSCFCCCCCSTNVLEHIYCQNASLDPANNSNRAHVGSYKGHAPRESRPVGLWEHLP